MTKSKVFIFRYEPQGSLEEMANGFKRAWKTGEPSNQLPNVLVSNSLEAIYRCLTPARLQIFTCLVKKKSNNLTELVQLINRDYANVWRDCQSLKSLGIIELRKQGKEIQPIALYERIIFDFGVSKEKVPLRGSVLTV